MTPIETPYAGLVPYTEAQAAFFFGREHESDIIISNLMAARLTILYGASGVGKSSVLRAGVIPRLHDLARDNISELGRPDSVVVAFSSWRDDTVRALVDRVCASVGQALDQPPVDASGDLNQVLERCAEVFGGSLLIILDQFEEYFVYHAYDDGPGTFAFEFPRTVNNARGRVNFLISIREDALAKLDRFKGRIPSLFNNYLRMDHLDPQAARRAIEKPIEQFNRLYAGNRPAVTLEPSLVEAVLDQVKTGRVALTQSGRGLADVPGSQDDRIETPYLQLVMTRLWDEEIRQGSTCLRLATLQSLGGAAHLVQTHLDTTMAGFTPAEQEVAARIFHHLVTPSGTKIAHTATDLADYADLDAAVITPVLEKLSSGGVRILRPVAPPLHERGEMRYEIFHDVLAVAVLDWRARQLEAETRTAAEKKLAEERAAAATRLEAERQKNRRLAWALAATVAGVIVVASLAIYAYVVKLRADAMRDAAAHARGQSEQLVAFMIGEDLLERLSRLSLMAMREEVQKRVNDYLAGVPPGAMTRESKTTAAFASLNTGDLALLRGDLDASRRAYQDAVDQFRALRLADKSDNRVTGGLARALERAADLAGEEGNVRRDQQFRDEALALRFEVAKRQPEDDRARRRLAQAHVDLASVLRMQGHLEDAWTHIEAATDLIARPRPEATPEWDYVEADKWDAAAQIANQRHQHALVDQIYQNLRTTATRLRQTLPFEAQAQYTYALAMYHVAVFNPQAIDETGTSTEERGTAKTQSSRGRTNALRREQQRQADIYRDLFGTLDAMARWEPQNERAFREVAAARMWIGAGAVALGQYREGIDRYKESLRQFEALSKRHPTNASYRSDLVWAHRWIADVDALDTVERRDHLRAALATGRELSQLDPNNRDFAYDEIRMEIDIGKLETQEADTAAAYERAGSTLERVAAIDRSDSDYFDLLVSYHTARAQAFEHGDPDGALRAASQAVDAAAAALAGRHDPLSVNSYVSSLRLFGRRQEAGGDTRGATTTYQNAIAALRDVDAGGRREDAASAWNQTFLVMYDNVAPMQVNQHDAAGALRSYRESVTAVERAIQLAPDYAVYRSNLGLALRRLGDALRDGAAPDADGAAAAYARAEQAFTKARELRDPSTETKSAASDWNRIFQLYYSGVAPLEQKKKALQPVLAETYHHAIAAGESASALAPSDPTYHWNVYLGHLKIADLFRIAATPDNTGALAQYRAALAEIERAAALDPRDVEYVTAVATTHRTTARLLDDLGDQPEVALAEYQKGIEAAKQATVLKSDDANAWNLLAISQADRAHLLDQLDRSTDAVAAYRAAIQADERASALTPNDPVYRTNVSKMQVSVGDLLRYTDSAAAADAYEKAIAILRADRDPSHQDGYDDQYVDAYVAAANLSSDSQATVKAHALFAVALQHARQRVNRSPEVVQNQLTLADLLLTLQGSTAAPGSADFKPQAVAILQKLDSKGQLPADWKARLATLTRE